MPFNRTLTKGEHVHRFMVQSHGEGWEVREEEDAALVKRVHRDDWHRVERDGLLFAMTARDLIRRGWIDQ